MHWGTGECHSWQTLQADPWAARSTAGEGQLDNDLGLCHGGWKPPVLILLPVSAHDPFFSCPSPRAWHFPQSSRDWILTVWVKGGNPQRLNDHELKVFSFTPNSQYLVHRLGQSEDNTSLSNPLRGQSLHPLALNWRCKWVLRHLARKVAWNRGHPHTWKGKTRQNQRPTTSGQPWNCAPPTCNTLLQ